MAWIWQSELSFHESELPEVLKVILSCFFQNKDRRILINFSHLWSRIFSEFMKFLNERKSFVISLMEWFYSLFRDRQGKKLIIWKRDIQTNIDFQKNITKFSYFFVLIQCWKKIIFVKFQVTQNFCKFADCFSEFEKS